MTIIIIVIMIIIIVTATIMMKKLIGFSQNARARMLYMFLLIITLSYTQQSRLKVRSHMEYNSTRLSTINHVMEDNSSTTIFIIIIILLIVFVIIVTMLF